MWHITWGSCARSLPRSSASPDSTAPCYEHTAPAEAAKGACAAASRQRAVSAGTGAALGAPRLAAPLQLVSGWLAAQSLPGARGSLAVPEMSQHKLIPPPCPSASAHSKGQLVSPIRAACAPRYVQKAGSGHVWANSNHLKHRLRPHASTLSDGRRKSACMKGTREKEFKYRRRMVKLSATTALSCTTRQAAGKTCKPRLFSTKAALSSGHCHKFLFPSRKPHVRETEPPTRSLYLAAGCGCTLKGFAVGRETAEGGEQAFVPPQGAPAGRSVRCCSTRQEA